MYRAGSSTLARVNKGNLIPRRTFNSIPKVPSFVNEPVYGYMPGSKERQEIQKQIKHMRENPVEIPIIIGGKEIRTGEIGEVRPPHDHQKVVATFHQANADTVKLALAASKEAAKDWAELDAHQRYSIFLKMADLLAGPYRQVLNAATVLGQSKNYLQAEVDSACEIIDFLRFNVHAFRSLTEQQPISVPGVWNRSEYRPLEGFIYACSPFNFTAIAANLATSPAIVGNVVNWKPSHTAILSGYWLTQLYKEAGVPDGVINFIPGPSNLITEHLLNDPQFAGLHYTGSTNVFNSLWNQIAQNLPKYKTYPRIVGETGGKDFIFAHSSADVDALVVGLVRGAFEYAGQKCSACSRAYVPKSIWPKVKEGLVETLKKIKTGNPEEPDTFVNAVIHEASADKCIKYIQLAKESNECEIISGGKVDKSVGWFVEPTVIQTSNPRHVLMKEEIFAPILTIYVYEDNAVEETLTLCDETSGYSLTGSIFSQDRYFIQSAEKRLRNSAGNFYINDKCTGAVVGQQPFGGGRVSGTNDKAGSMLNLLRWTSVRSVKETFVPPTEVLYPYMK